MPAEIALFGPVDALPEVPAPPQAHSDDQLIAIWLHGRSVHTQRAYAADIVRFRREGQPLPSVTLTDLQSFADSLGALAAASRYRILSALKSMLAFGHRIGYLPFDVGRALRLPGVRNRLTERILPEAEIHHILSLEPKERNRVLLTLLYASAVRVSEVCGLCWRNAQANGDGGQITASARTLYAGRPDCRHEAYRPLCVCDRQRVDAWDVIRWHDDDMPLGGGRVGRERDCVRQPLLGR